MGWRFPLCCSRVSGPAVRSRSCDGQGCRWWVCSRAGGARRCAPGHLTRTVTGAEYAPYPFALRAWTFTTIQPALGHLLGPALEGARLRGAGRAVLQRRPGAQVDPRAVLGDLLGSVGSGGRPAHSDALGLRAGPHGAGRCPVGLASAGAGLPLDIRSRSAPLTGASRAAEPSPRPAVDGAWLRFTEREVVAAVGEKARGAAQEEVGRAVNAYAHRQAQGRAWRGSSWPEGSGYCAPCRPKA